MELAFANCRADKGSRDKKNNPQANQISQFAGSCLRRSLVDSSDILWPIWSPITLFLRRSLVEFSTHIDDIVTVLFQPQVFATSAVPESESRSSPLLSVSGRQVLSNQCKHWQSLGSFLSPSDQMESFGLFPPDYWFCGEVGVVIAWST